MTRDLSRLLRPKSIALFGGGWAVNVVAQLKKSGFDGDIWPVNPKRADILGVPCLASIDDLPSAPDASFIGVNRDATIEVVEKLSAMGAGGATCFASGFLESEAETAGGAELQARLIEAAGDMPILGPNCYGLLNYLDNVTLWPDQHGAVPVDSGVAIVAQSSNIAINMTMQARGLPIAYVVAAGNQAQTGASAIAEALLDDDRVTAIGLYLEGFGDLRALEAFAARARIKGKPVVAIKIGRSDKARAATMTHTASLAGSAAAGSALLMRLGIIEVETIAVFLETLKLLHMIGPLPGDAVCSVSCSGGEASLMADLSGGTLLDFAEFEPGQRAALKAELGPIVTIANPLDYHTFIWGDTPRMTRVFATVMSGSFDLSVFVLDMPRADRCDPSGYQCAVDAILAAKAETGARAAVLASLPENMSDHFTRAFMEGGVAVLHGMSEGIAAISAAIAAGRLDSLVPQPIVLAGDAPGPASILSEAASKQALSAFGLGVPQSVAAPSVEDLLRGVRAMNYPLALKGTGVAHKSEAGLVALNIADAAQLEAEARKMLGVATGYLAEEMIVGGLAEVLVGITRDPTGAFMLTLGAGGVLTEILSDTAHLLLPASRSEIMLALDSLRIAPLFAGYRGKPAADREALSDAVLSICLYASAQADRLVELEVNPLIARAGDAIAVDALIRLTDAE
ncbi:MAG: acetate--CoA ligase family protein [Hoeflea sp.]|uniref:acetate--CoA ligase family protein n=1 Tax=Hoeflea sp. TaxID=1940281 RepID=UPI001D62EE6F|nr:acetate--CoA ligase family protein [Hoeflea sp.]MBU4529049.1 acetate--CoA ligase family protein [Alphaproteobacteria bacterium]MBU4543454.1 acetate--CoA ligase family protein [Alphaproteobacteria bacterium]MBU4549079.1 acetate--CoA ligase family protein [Alphaproteobacteria bacterium]MBV1725214.1 acetate--CoA ligase family protein [Hoeflea sp.]MBV1785175.1 acetate--CoA ligase family protein [Hoeflea sp.]